MDLNGKTHREQSYNEKIWPGRWLVDEKPGYPGFGEKENK
jgi:hypothetical protein